MTVFRPALLALLMTSSALGQSGAAGQSPQWGSLSPGPHAAGFRLLETHDHTRTTGPAVDYQGKRAGAELSIPMQIGVWYPAVAPVEMRPMSTLDLKLASIKKTEFAPPTAADSSTVRQDIAWAVRISGADSTRPEARPEFALAMPTSAFRDAPPARGSFPVAVVGSSGSIANVSVLAEYLASHGWIVLATPSSDVSARLEVTEPKIALEDRLRALEFLVATARGLRGADVRRLALVGVNFDSYAAIEHQMRHMQAAAIVTLNGWETIESRFEVLTSSLWFDVARIRVPLFNAHWDEEGPGFPPANLTFLRQLKYSDRHHLLVRGLNHFGLVGNPMAYPFTSATQRTGYEYLARAVRAFLDGAVIGNADSARVLIADPASAGYPRDLLKAQWYRAGLPAVPTRGELVEILWDRRDIGLATRLFREARARDTAAQLFREGDLNLYAFRYRAIGRLEDALAVHRLTLEAYPGSYSARNNIGNLLLARSDTAAAIREFEAALELLSRSTRLPAQEKAAQEAAWRERIARLRQ